MNSKFSFLLILSALSLFFTIEYQEPVIYLIGDSTMADKPLDDNPERGWGQLFPLFIKPGIKVENYAKNGRSTKSFINEGLWSSVFGKLNENDFVFIQFGHNDAKIGDSTRYAEPNTTYRNNLIRIINDTRSKKANPILLTPVSRRWFDENNKLKDMHSEYATVVKEVAEQMNVPIIDIYSKSRSLLSTLGPEKSKELYLWVDSGKYKALPKGKKDDTHFNRHGAFKMASMVVDGIKELSIPLKNYLTEPPQLIKETKKMVALDYYFNNEYKKDLNGNKVRYHYVWEDKENSGFNVLGNIFENYGSRLSIVTSPPDNLILSRSSIYIIVDPDTPVETDTPHYIDDTSIRIISEWVKQGGVLLLMANDSSNCEFRNFNKLSSVFGITFNEVSENKVIKNNYEMGKFENLSQKELFNGVKKIFMKEVCNISLSKNAKGLLQRDYKTYIASSSFGKGYVLAVSDPWLYNEYIDSRKIPSEFENIKAANNLVKLLLKKAREIN